MIQAPNYIAVARDSDPKSLSDLQTFFARENPGYHFSILHLDGEQTVSCQSGVAYLWLRDGEVDAFIERSGQPSAAKKLCPGDVVAVTGSNRAMVKGRGVLWRIDCTRGHPPHPSDIRKLADLPDTAGGCNPSENAFRRLQITWSDQDTSEANPDGSNLLGCHVVWIAEQSSRTHYHPPKGKGFPQHEMYLVLRPEDHGLRADAPNPGVWTYPEPGRWDEFDFTPLSPGDVVSIPAGVSHRAVDILACVIAIPGFKPDNDLYVDPLIAESSRGESPHNPAYAAVSSA